jgi:cytochrome c oxidase cbb3-type subunit 3
MLERHKHKHGLRTFDGIVDNRVQHIPKAFSMLFWALVIWGALYSGYYLLSGWSSEAEFTARMEAHRQAVTQPR